MASNKTQKQLHVTLFTFPPFVHHYPDGWRHPQEMLGGTYDPLEPDIWARVARTLESMKVDAFFVGDGGAIFFAGVVESVASRLYSRHSRARERRHSRD